MNQNVNFAIFGCGFIANTHAKALIETKSAALVGCADVVKENAERFAERYRIKAYENLDDILNSPEIDAVCICTPSGTHADLAEAALQKNKNVVVEKPMATTADGCKRIISALEKSSAKLTVISQLRTSEDIQKAKEIIESGKLGKLVLCDLYMKYHRSAEYYKGSWKGTKRMDGGGALMNQGIHGVDLLLYLVGMPVSIKSTVRTLVHDIEVEDTALALLEYECGAVGVIEATTSVTPGNSRRLEIHGTRGTMVISENTIVSLNIDGIEQPPTAAPRQVRGVNDPGNLDSREHQKQLCNFVDSILSGTPLLVDAYSGSRAVQVIEEIYKGDGR